jgi:superfamily I DNA and RNA helicase
MQSTALAGIGQFGKHAVRRFTGEYDMNHEQIYTDGDLRFETIYRFKGQQAPAVILVDMDQNLESNEQKSAVLYCAMTRATVRLELVVRKNCPWLSSFRDNVVD